MNFGSLKYFLELKTIKNELKFVAQCRAESWPAATVHDLAACHAQLIERPAGPRLGGPVQSRRRPVRCARVGVVTTRGTTQWRARWRPNNG
jgi:hypothetical protein